MYLNAAAISHSSWPFEAEEDHGGLGCKKYIASGVAIVSFNFFAFVPSRFQFSSIKKHTKRQASRGNSDFSFISENIYVLQTRSSPLEKNQLKVLYRQNKDIPSKTGRTKHQWSQVVESHDHRRVTLLVSKAARQTHMLLLSFLTFSLRTLILSTILTLHILNHTLLSQKSLFSSLLSHLSCLVNPHIKLMNHTPPHSPCCVESMFSNFVSSSNFPPKARLFSSKSRLRNTSTITGRHSTTIHGTPLFIPNIDDRGTLLLPLFSTQISLFHGLPPPTFHTEYHLLPHRDTTLLCTVRFKEQLQCSVP